MRHATVAASESGSTTITNPGVLARCYACLERLAARPLQARAALTSVVLGLLLTIGVAPRAGAQPPPPICDTCINPVTIQITNVPSLTRTATITPYVYVCANPLTGDTVELNGSKISFTVTNCTTTHQNVTLPIGQNNFAVLACSGYGNGNPGECSDAGANSYYDPIQVTPKGGLVVDAGISYDTSQVFTLENTGSAAETYTETASCTGSPAPCTITRVAWTSKSLSPNTDYTDTVYYTTTGSAGVSGTVQLKAICQCSVSAYDSGYVNVTAQWPPFFAAGASYTNQEDQDMSRCATVCFAALTSMSTVPYYSQDVARNVTLIYNGDRMQPRPIVMADVLFDATLPYTVTDLQLQVLLNGTTWARFTNGQDTLHFNPANVISHPGVLYRIGGQFDDTVMAYENGPTQMKVIVTAVFRDNQGTYAGAEQVVDSTHFLTVNRTWTNGFPRGWTFAGWSQLYYEDPFSATYMAAGEGDGTVRVYGPISANCNSGSRCVWYPVSPGVTDTLIWNNPNSYMERHFADGSKWIYTLNPPAPVVIYKIDRLGDTTRYAYQSGTALLDTIYDPYRSYNGGRTGTVLWYNSASVLDSIGEPAQYPTNTPGQGRKTRLTINSSGQLTAWEDPDLVNTYFSYDGDKRLTHVIDRRGDTTTFVYRTDSSWKLAQIIAPKVPIDSASTGSPVTESPSMTYQAWQMSAVPYTTTSETSQATPMQTSTIVASVTDAAHHTNTYTPDTWGQPVIAVDALGDTTTITRDANGFPSVVTYPTGGHEQFSYSNGLLQWHLPIGGDTVYYSYGADNQVSQVRSRHAPTSTADLDPAGPAGALPYKTWINTDSAHATYLNWQQIRENGGPWFGLTSTVDAAGHTVQSTYDTTTGNRATTSGEYSEQRDSIRFDGYGRDSVIVNGAEPAVKIYYDLMNRPIKRYDGVNPNPTVIHYDAMFQDTVIDPKSQIYSFQHNALGWEISRTDPGNNTTYETYTQIGLPATLKNRRGQLQTYRYDAVGRLLAKHDPGAGDSATYVYTIATNNVQRVATNHLETDTYYSDSSGWTDSVKTFVGAANKTYTQHYKHTDQQQLDSVWVTGSALTFTWANLRMRWDTLTGLLDSTFVNGNGIRAHYDGEYVRDSLTYPSNVVVADSVGSMDSHQRTARHFMNTSGSVLTSLDTAFYRAYSYDSSGKIIEEDRHTAATTYGQQFAYDGTGELSSWWVDSASLGWHCLPNKNCYKDSGAVYTAGDTMTYDAAGNIDSSAAMANGPDSTIGAAYKTGNRDSTWRTAGDTLRYWYDLDGERDSLHGPGGAKYYTWAADGRLLSVKAGSRTVSYGYNADGMLMQRSINGVVDRYFVWDRGNLRAEIDSTGANRINEYVEIGGTDQPLARIIGTSTTVHYYTQDAIGNVLGHFSGATLEENLRYDPWGKLIAAGTTLSDTTRLRWKGLYWEGDSTRMYYDRARWYDPEQRRFASEDPLGLAASINDYTYASGDPVNGSDPSGMEECGGEAAGDESCTDNGGGGGSDDYGGWGGDDGGWDTDPGPMYPCPPSGCPQPGTTTTGVNPDICVGSAVAGCMAEMALKANLANIQAIDDAIAEGQVALPSLAGGGASAAPTQRSFLACVGNAWTSLPGKVAGVVSGIAGGLGLANTAKAAMNTSRAAQAAETLEPIINAATNAPARINPALLDYLPSAEEAGAAAETFGAYDAIAGTAAAAATGALEVAAGAAVLYTGYAAISCALSR